jgi:hypothetical protein
LKIVQQLLKHAGSCAMIGAEVCHATRADRLLRGDDPPDPVASASFQNVGTVEITESKGLSRLVLRQFKLKSRARHRFVVTHALTSISYQFAMFQALQPRGGLKQSLRGFCS